MKARIFNKILLCFAVYSLLAYSTAAQEEEMTKKFHETFATTANSSLLIDNKYGNVSVNDWDDNKVEIDIIVRVDDVSREKAERILSYINVSLSQEGDEIKAITNFDDRFSKIGDGNHRLEINYTVNLQKDIKLTLLNKYGNVSINDLTGESIIDIKYGKLQANSIVRGNEKPLSEINLAYSEATIKEAGWLKSDLKYSIIKIKKCKALVLYSKYSKIYIDEASSIVNDSKYDYHYLGKLSNFVINAEYTNMEIKEITEKLECVTSYTNCTVDFIPAGFKSINLETKYGHYKLGIDKDASYKLDGNAGYSKITYNESEKVSKISENTFMKVFGIVGKDDNTSSVVTVSTKYGNVNLDN